MIEETKREADQRLADAMSEIARKRALRRASIGKPTGEKSGSLRNVPAEDIPTGTCLWIDPSDPTTSFEPWAGPRITSVTIESVPMVVVRTENGALGAVHRARCLDRRRGRDRAQRFRGRSRGRARAGYAASTADGRVMVMR
jgi:hypothetical protein